MHQRSVDFYQTICLFLLPWLAEIYTPNEKRLWVLFLLCRQFPTQSPITRRFTLYPSPNPPKLVVTMYSVELGLQDYPFFFVLIIQRCYTLDSNNLKQIQNLEKRKKTKHNLTWSKEEIRIRAFQIVVLCHDSPFFPPFDENQTGEIENHRQHEH